MVIKISGPASDLVLVGFMFIQRLLSASPGSLTFAQPRSNNENLPEMFQDSRVGHRGVSVRYFEGKPLGVGSPCCSGLERDGTKDTLARIR